VPTTPIGSNRKSGKPVWTGARQTSAIESQAPISSFADFIAVACAVKVEFTQDVTTPSSPACLHNALSIVAMALADARERHAIAVPFLVKFDPVFEIGKIPTPRAK
jgi:hypothetical protein